MLTCHGNDGETATMASQKKQKLAQSERRKHERLKALKGERKPDSQGAYSIEQSPPGYEKMSEVLEEFVRPFLEESGYETVDQQRKVFDLAVLTWNISLFPEDQQDQELNEVVKQAPADIQLPLRRLLNRMIARKNAYFSQNRRAIMGFELTDTGDDFHLQVASSV